MLTYHLTESTRLSPDEVLMSLDEEQVDLLLSADERLFPKPVSLVVEQLDEGDDETPWMRTSNDDALEEDSADTLRDTVRDLGAGCGTEDEKHEGGEE